MCWRRCSPSGQLGLHSGLERDSAQPGRPLWPFRYPPSPVQARSEQSAGSDSAPRSQVTSQIQEWNHSSNKVATVCEVVCRCVQLYLQVMPAAGCHLFTVSVKEQLIRLETLTLGDQNHYTTISHNK